MMPRDVSGRMLPSALMTSAELREAFLLRLATHGAVAFAAAEMGLAVSTLYRVRRRLPDFAAGWDAALAAAAPRSRRGMDVWPAAARDDFVEAIGEGVSPAQAAIRVGQKLASAYRLRGASSLFAAAWDAAASRAIDLIEAEVAQGILHGFVTVETCGEVVTVKRSFSERMMTLYLKAFRPERYDRVQAARQAEKAPPPPFDRAEMINRLKIIMRRVAGTGPDGVPLPHLAAPDVHADRDAIEAVQ